jgi:hypothetical protein
MKMTREKPGPGYLSQEDIKEQFEKGMRYYNGQEGGKHADALAVESFERVLEADPYHEKAQEMLSELCGQKVHNGYVILGRATARYTCEQPPVSNFHEKK